MRAHRLSLSLAETATWKPATPGRVVEYGIGAGLLGETLLTQRGASHYTGLDISDRQLIHAEKRLTACCVTRFSLIRVDALNAAHLRNAQTFVSQAVIQHFPSVEYFQAFCRARDVAPASLMLQVRQMSPADNRPTSVLHATNVSRADLTRLLPSFRVKWQSARRKNGYVFYVLERARVR